MKKNWPKYLLQWGVLLALVVFLAGIIPSKEAADPEAYCPLGGLQAVVTYLVNGSLPCSMSMLQIMMGIVLAFAVMLFSKLFCGYVCPIGSVEDLMIRLRKALHVKPVTIRNGSVLDSILRVFKYILLFWIFYTTATASELFCKNLDPYYAVATGFKGEITLWMSITSLVLVLLFGFFINRFWCRYICPLGAASNTFKFWGKLLILFGICYAVIYFGGRAGYEYPWWVFFAAFCLFGYMQETFNKKPKLQVLDIIKSQEACTGCGICSKACPYDIDVAHFKGTRLEHVDCTLCGECTAACPVGAIQTGVCFGAKGGFWKYLPLLLVVVFFFAGIFLSKHYELPTINETWGIEARQPDGSVKQLTDPSTLKEFSMEGLRSVKCYGSSMAFAAKLQQIRGVHGVKTYVASHKAVISYDPAVTDPESIQEVIYVPSKFRVKSPDPDKVPVLKCVTLRTEKMGDKLDLNYLGLQFRLTGKAIYGLESEFACPLIVRVYMDPAEELDEDWFREVVDKKTLEFPLKGGEVKVTPVDFEFVRMEKGSTTMDTPSFIKMMFNGFQTEFKKKAEEYASSEQYIYEMVNPNYEKPIIRRNLPFLSNFLSQQEGVIGVYLQLNGDLQTALQVRYAAPMTEERLWNLLNEKVWTIKYGPDDIREEPAKIAFKEKGTVHPYVR